MNDDQLRHLLHQSAVPAWDDEVRASSALYAGRSVVTRRRLRSRALGAGATAVLGAGLLVALLPTTHAPPTDVVLGCAPGVGTTGAGAVAGGVGGVTLSVTNPTRDVLTVAAGGATAMALPGTSSVTLPLHAGTSTVRCGKGSPVRLTVLGSSQACTSVDVALTSTVQRGGLVELTRAHLGALPEGSVVDAPRSTDPVRRVQVRAGGRVVAEAVWHAMPADASWQLESVSRCA